MAGLPLEDADLAALLAAFPHLRVLHLTGCQKLSPGAANLMVPVLAPGRGSGAGRQGLSSRHAAPGGAVDSSSDSQGAGSQSQRDEAGRAAGAAAGGSGRLPALSVVDLQRCYQLNAEALTSLLAAAQGSTGGDGFSGSSLGAALLSHLTLEAWPPSNRQAGRDKDVDGTAYAAAPRMPADTMAVHSRTAGCSQHEHGSLVAKPLVAATAPRTMPWSGLHILALHNCVYLTPAGLQVIH